MILFVEANKALILGATAAKTWLATHLRPLRPADT